MTLDSSDRGICPETSHLYEMLLYHSYPMCNEYIFFQQYCQLICSVLLIMLGHTFLKSYLCYLLFGVILTKLHSMCIFKYIFQMRNITYN